MTGLIVVSWNTHVGAARIASLLDDLRSQAGGGARVGIVLLLQEVFRRGPDVPAPPPAGSDGAGRIRPPDAAADIVATARSLGLSLAYVPSMRNGEGPEDRGNAILSSEPLDEIGAIELPFGRQRRVAVTAIVRPGGTDAALRVVSVHLDTGGARSTQARALATTLNETGAGLPTVVGGDLNALWGRRDAAFAALDAVVPAAECGTRRTNTWPWRLDLFMGWWRSRVDYLFAAPPASGAMQCETLRDRYGSDHRPIVLRLATR